MTDRWLTIKEMPEDSTARFKGYRVVLHHLTRLGKTEVWLRTFWAKDAKDVNDPVQAEADARAFANAVSTITGIEVRA